MPSGVELLSQTDHMNPTAYGSPQGALFAGNMGPSFMDPFGNIHSNAAVTDPYTAPALFAPSPGAPAAYLYQTPPSQPVANPADEIRTVFVSGFPHDVKERELHNLLRFMPGYEASQMNWKTGGPQGFALFNSSVHARAVVEILSGLQFDDGVVIRAEMAHKNMFIKPEDPSVKRAARHSPAYIAPTTIMAPVSQMAGNAALGGAPLSPAAPAFLAAAAAAAAAAGSPPVHVSSMLSPVPLRPTSFSPVTNLRDNPPCNTLFIGNLGDNTNEQELRALLSSQPGYRQMKMVRGPKSTTAFVEFSDVSSAIMVHSALQGAVLASSDRGGIRVQYSKNPFGRRDVSSSSPHTPAITPSAEDVAGLVSSPGNVGMQSAGGVNTTSLLSNMTGATNMVTPGGFIGQAGLDTVLGTGES